MGSVLRLCQDVTSHHTMILRTCAAMLISATPSIATITFSCFSYPLFDFPSLGLSSTSGIFVNSNSNILTDVGANNRTFSADFCFFAIASVLLLEVFPSILSSQGGQLLRRISGTLEPTEGPVPPSLEGPVEHYIMPGTRRLDMDVAEYEYVDTFPPSEPLNFRKHSAPDIGVGEDPTHHHHVGEVVATPLVQASGPVGRLQLVSTGGRDWRAGQ